MTKYYKSLRRAKASRAIIAMTLGFLIVLCIMFLMALVGVVSADCEDERCPDPTPTPDPCAEVECDPEWCEHPELCTEHEWECCCEGPPTAVELVTMEGEAVQEVTTWPLLIVALVGLLTGLVVLRNVKDE